MSPPRVVPDFIAGYHPNPPGNGPILLLGLGRGPLDPEGLVGRHGEGAANARTPMAEKESVFVIRKERKVKSRLGEGGWHALYEE